MHCCPATASDMIWGCSFTSADFCVVLSRQDLIFSFFFFNDTATTEIYTLSLHDALPISGWHRGSNRLRPLSSCSRWPRRKRSEEHTSELQSHLNLVCRLLLEKKNNHLPSGTSQQCGSFSAVAKRATVSA